MLNFAENRMWLRYLAVDRIRQYQRQLESLPTFFHLALHGLFLDEEDTTRDLIASLLECPLVSIFVEDVQCSRSTWDALENCLQVLSDKAPGFQLRLRRIQLLPDETSESNSEEGDDDDNGDDEEQETSDVYLARRLSKFVQRPTADGTEASNISEFHILDCNWSSHAAQVFFSGLHNGTNSLQLLSLEGNSIGNAGVRFLAEALAGPLSGLQTLSIERAAASDEGISKLLESIRYNTTLQCLNLMRNTFSHTVLQLLSDILQTNNHTLKRIQWDGHDAQVDFWLRVNRAERHWLWQNDIHPPHRRQRSLLSLWPWILERLAQNDPPVLYYFVRSRPEICMAGSTSTSWRTETREYS